MPLNQLRERGGIPAKRWLAGLLFLFLLFMFNWQYVIKSGDYLVVSKLNADDYLVAEIIPASREFTIYYIHSVDRQPVLEKYEVLPNDEIVLKETRFKMFGAGMGHFSGEGTLAFEDGWTVIKELERKVDPIYLRIGYTSNLTMIIDDNEILLSVPELYGELVIVRVEELTKIELLQKGVKNKWANQL